MNELLIKSITIQLMPSRQIEIIFNESAMAQSNGMLWVKERNEAAGS